MTEKKDVWISLWYHASNSIPAFADAPDLGSCPHARIAMRHMGITYKQAVPFSTLDGWRFYDCENIPEMLPEWATVCPHKGFFGEGGEDE
ncbi:hypothetical protein GOB91_29330 [Sinorhizobium meliloti]|nr:hypothetical protein [Sinorhizobium meliloti]MDW9732657.1 hypothetical protein [Sinorhizobium meliloti]